MSTRSGNGPRATGARVRATSTTRVVAAAGPEQAARTTAELPVVRRDGPGGLPHRGTGPVRVRRFPAPIGLRIAVWLLTLLFVLAAGGAAVAIARPDAVAVLRHVSAAPTPTPATDSAASLDSSGFRRVGTSGTSANYAVPTAAYTLVVTAVGACGVAVTSPIGARATVFDRTIAAGTTASIPVTGSSSLRLAGEAGSIVLRAGGSVIGMIAAPKAGETYTFTPETR